MGAPRTVEKAPAFFAKHYKKRHRQLGRLGVVRENHSPATTNNVNEISVRWDHTFLYYLQRLGMMAGMMKILNPYNIRRGTGEAVDGESHHLL